MLSSSSMTMTLGSLRFVEKEAAAVGRCLARLVGLMIETVNPHELSLLDLCAVRVKSSSERPPLSDCRQDEARLQARLVGGPSFATRLTITPSGWFCGRSGS